MRPTCRLPSTPLRRSRAASAWSTTARFCHGSAADRRTLSDKRVGEVAAEVRALKTEWQQAGCQIPYMGFNLIPLSVIPEIRITDKGLVLVPEMRLVPLFEEAGG